jgi:hypothetical protein
VKDFLKILAVLIVIVIAFVTGRNYGEQSVVESKEFKDNKTLLADTTRAEEELRITKEKFQALLDSADLKKADEIYGKIMTIFLVDLGLRISEAKQKDLDEGKNKLSMCVDPKSNRPVEKVVEKPKEEPQPTRAEEMRQEKEKTERFSQLNPGRFKSTEWTLMNSDSNAEIRRNLEKLKLTDIDAFIKGAPETSYENVLKYFGTYRGKVTAVDDSDYGSLVIAIGPGEKQNHATGDVKFYRKGKQESHGSFTSASWGYSPAGYQGNMVQLGGRFLQIYKLESAQKLAGNFYERLPNGTTKLIGSFVLNRTDQF